MTGVRRRPRAAPHGPRPLGRLTVPGGIAEVGLPLVAGGHRDGIQAKASGVVLSTDQVGTKWGRPVGAYRSLRWPALERILTRAPLGYRVTRQSGSHRTLEAAGRPALRLGFHDKQEIPPGLVRKILVRDIGLTDEEALRLL